MNQQALEALSEELEAVVLQAIGSGVRLDELVREAQRRYVKALMESYRGNASWAAASQGLHRNTLMLWIRELGLGEAVAGMRRGQRRPMGGVNTRPCYVGGVRWEAGQERVKRRGKGGKGGVSAAVDGDDGFAHQQAEDEEGGEGEPAG